MLKATSAEFTSMRGLAMRFRGILKGADPAKLAPWLDDALSSRIHCMRQFAIKLRQDAAAVRNAITEVMEQWPSRGPDQSIENAEARDVWPAGHRPAAGQDVVTEATLRTHSLRKTYRE
jgi:hypothetical protein